MHLISGYSSINKELENETHRMSRFDDLATSQRLSLQIQSIFLAVPIPCRCFVLATRPRAQTRGGGPDPSRGFSRPPSDPPRSACGEMYAEFGINKTCQVLQRTNIST